MNRSTKLILFIGILLVVFNTFLGLVCSGYDPTKMLLADFSIALSTGLLLFSARDGLSDGLKIPLLFTLVLTGAIRTACLLCAESRIEDNYLIIAAAGIFLFELFCLGAASYINHK